MSTYGVFSKRKIKEAQLEKEAEKMTREIFTGEILENSTENEKKEE